MADENERSETEASTTVKPTDPFPELIEEEEEDEEVELSPQKEKDTSPLKLPQAILDENVCIEDGSVLLVMLVGRKLEAEGKLRVTSQKLSFLGPGKLDDVML